MEIVFQQISDEELVNRFQLAATGNPAHAHDFFAQFDYNIYLQNQQFRITSNKIISLLQKLKQLDLEAYKRIHKGAPFYFNAISGFMLHNYIQAIYFFDAAVSEDLKNDHWSRTPAIMFLEMDGDPNNQAARQLTQIAENKLLGFINEYNQVQGAIPTVVQEIRSKFLSHAVGDKLEWRTMATSFITYLLEWDYLQVLQDIRVQDGTWEPFFTHLFKGCVLFESLLKCNPTVLVPEDQLGNILNGNVDIRSALGINRHISTRGPTFADVLVSLTGNNIDLQTDIGIVARLRNTIGHNIGWATPMTPTQYIQLGTKIANTILHTISALF